MSIELRYPRTYQDVGGYYITHHTRPGEHQVEYRDGHCFDTLGNPLRDGWERAYQFGPWDVPQDEADRERILGELREVENRLWRELKELHDLRDAMAKRVTVEQLNKEMHG